MLKINKLYTEPEVIDPIRFSDGLNLILGEEDDSSNKTNGVGKTLCIEFINFALLKKKAKSRVALIPEASFPIETLICIDFEIHGNQFSLKRSLQDSEQPVLVDSEGETKFLNLEDAANFLTEKLFSESEQSYPSFRTMLGPLIRDERSEFKSLVSCYDTKDRVPDNYAPHLYLLDIDIDIYDRIKALIYEIDELTKDLRRVKENVWMLRQKEIKDARSDLNELDSEVAEIERSIDALENVSGYEIVKDDIIQLEDCIAGLRRKKYLLNQEFSRMRPIIQGPRIESGEVEEFYDQLKEGLGQLVARDLNEVYAFKEKIDQFQNQLINDRRKVIEKETKDIEKELTALDKQYSEKLGVLDQEGNLRNLKQTYAAFQEKTDEASQLRSFIDKFEELERRKQIARSNKESDLLKLQSAIQDSNELLGSFEETILSMHEFIQGNRRASFDIYQTSKKQVIEIDMRIDDDGSHSVDRLKVFIYDMSLLLNDQTSRKHPGLLIHDNIFDVDQDTLIKSLGYLDERASFAKGQQYLLTLNADRVAIDERGRDLLSNLGGNIRARFTKQNRFLKTKYQESR